MKAFLYLSASVCLLTLAVSTTLLCTRALEMEKHADAAILDLDEAIKQQNIDLAQDEFHLDQVMGDLQGTISELNVAAKQQQAYWAKTSADSDKTVKALRLTTDRLALLMKHTDEQLNSSLLPDLDRQLNLTTEQAQLTLGSIGHASDALTFQINDLGPIVANLSETSAQLALSSQHADKILADGEHTADYYEKRLTTPASFAKRVGMTLLDVGSKLGNIMSGFVK